LTGESFPQEKNRGDEIHAGSVVLSGEGEAVVAETGRRTRLGKIASAVKTVKPPRTPLQLAMKSLAGKLVVVAVFFSLFIPLMGVLRGQNAKTMVLTGLSLAFATIPEELPIIITMVLGLGAYTLSKNKFLVKKIKATETLGNATVIVADKTGTITESEMRIVFFYPGEKEHLILQRVLGSLSEYASSPLESEIKRRARELKLESMSTDAFRQRNVGENNKKTKAVVRKNENGFDLFLSGAPEEVFAVCRNLADDTRNALSEETAKGRRVIAVAHRRLMPGQELLDFSEIEKDMDFAGLIGFEDPPRKGVRETISIAARAGVRTIMVTGDHPLTAGFIAKEVGIPAERVAIGRDLDNLSDIDLREALKIISVFARTNPGHKYRIVKALQENGDVVAVTGDGINDVLALKGADIGIAMGIKGTDVAKEAAAVVLGDDNYVTITQGIFEGRKFFDNLQKGITYYLSVKFGLILTFLLPVLLGVPVPFSPIQIIILELFMDIAASAGFVAEPKERDIRSRPPRNPREGVITHRLIGKILFNGMLLFCAVISVYFYAGYQNMSLGQTQTFAFSAWISNFISRPLI
jgi:Ca2+-transporting ATPase